MRILVGECVDPGIRDFLSGHDVTTVKDAGWLGRADAAILRLAAGNFDVFLTIDGGFEFQHNVAKLDFGIVIVHPLRNRRDDYERMTSLLRETLEQVHPGTVWHVRRG